MTSILTLTSFRGREHSDRRFAPSEHRLRERRPESITTGLPVCDAAHAPHPPGVMDSGRAGKSANPTYQLPGMTPKGKLNGAVQSAHAASVGGIAQQCGTIR